jgi:hypothetical protein
MDPTAARSTTEPAAQAPTAASNRPAAPPEPQPSNGGRRAPARPDIPGWGADLNKADRPAYPMERTPPRLDAPPAGLPTPQHRHVEVFHSTERPGMTPIFGSTVPPRGLSGRLRRAGYSFSENDLRRWLVLLAADRVDMVEGVISDLAHGHVPNLPAEMGWRAELRHNPAGAARKVAVLAVAGGLLYLWWKRRDERY